MTDPYHLDDELTPGSVAVVYGTRPEIIKLAPIVRLLGSRARLINTGQHFDRELSSVIANSVQLPNAEVNLGVGGKTRAAQIAQTLSTLERHIGRTETVIVQGDTNSALGGALVANSLEIPLMHVEAGLRSYDRSMPEEHNRVAIDHLADLCWAPTSGNVLNLEKEYIAESRIELTGNPIVEAIGEALPSIDAQETVLQEYGLSRHGYLLVTLHRPENVDEANRLREILRVLSDARIPVVFPIHPRTNKTVEEWGLNDLIDPLMVVPPLSYNTFLTLLNGCALAVSDSGGVQEEVSVLKVPLIVFRRSTERPEVLGTFAEIVDDPADLENLIELRIANIEDERHRIRGLPSPFGDGDASKRIAQSLLKWHRA